MNRVGAEVWQVELVDEQRGFSLSADQPLLESLTALGVSLRRACRNGACEICAVQLLQGEVEQRYPAGRFVGSEQSAPLIQLCTAYPRSDLRLRLMPYARGR